MMTLLGMDLGGTNVRVAVARDHQITTKRAVRWPTDLEPAGEVRFAADLAMDLIRQAANPAPVIAVGVALAAQIDRSGVVVQWPNRSGWQGLAVRMLLEEHLGIPVIVEDDANAAAIAEWTRGAGRGYHNLLSMVVGTGVGAGLILDGQLFRGGNGWAGELGHVVVVPDGPICLCGHRGCLQAVASGRALERLAVEHGLTGAADVTAAAERGDKWALAGLEDCGRWLGLAAANVVNLLDLEAVTVGGGLSTLNAPFWPALRQVFETTVANWRYRLVGLHRSTLHDTSGLLGAITLAKQLVESRKAPR